MTDRSLYDWFLTASETNLDGNALEVGEDALTYTELRTAAENMSARMVEALGAAPARVGLLTSRHVVSYIGYLAASRLGAAAVPLNPGAPALRNLDIAAEAELDLTVIDDRSGDGLEEYRRKSSSVLLDMTGESWRGLLVPDDSVAVPAQARRSSDDFAYIIFTSGTTGRPKGVPITHGNLSSLLTDAIPRFRMGPGCRVSQTFEMSFDGSVISIFGALCSGATLCVPQHSDVFTPVKFVNAKQLTHWMSVPSIISFAKRLRALAPGSMPTLRCSMFGGEGLTFEQAEVWSAAAPNSTAHNCYGPSETTVIITGYPVPRERVDWPETSNRSIPLGHPYPHLDWVLLDEDLRESDDGELCVRGAQRFPGYLDESENVGRFVTFSAGQGHIYDGGEPLTAEHYYRTGDRCRLEHGELVCLGRVDHQVKVRGHRVELGEIESVLRRHPAVAEIVVITVTAADGEIDLHALYTGGEVTVAEFARLLEQLPAYMHPRGFHRRESIPLTIVGKVDRKLLAADLESSRG